MLVATRGDTLMGSIRNTVSTVRPALLLVTLALGGCVAGPYVYDDPPVVYSSGGYGYYSVPPPGYYGSPGYYYGPYGYPTPYAYYGGDRDHDGHDRDHRGHDGHGPDQHGDQHGGHHDGQTPQGDHGGQGGHGGQDGHGGRPPHVGQPPGGVTPVRPPPDAAPRPGSGPRASATREHRESATSTRQGNAKHEGSRPAQD
jgi:hypothetical protein